MIESNGVDECLFVDAYGTARKDANYAFADVITAGILVGFSADSEEFSQALASAMSGTNILMVRFIDDGRVSSLTTLRRGASSRKRSCSPINNTDNNTGTDGTFTIFVAGGVHPTITDGVPHFSRLLREVNQSSVFSRRSSAQNQSSVFGRQSSATSSS